MKTLLIPALAFTLAGLSAHAQKSGGPGASSVPTTVERTVAPSEAPPGSPGTSLPPKSFASTPSPALLRKVQFDGETLSEVISVLNAKLAEQSADPVNVVVSAGLETTKIPSVFLQNVTATDVMNVIAQITDLRVEPVPSESGKVAAWIITKGKPAPRKTSAKLFGGGLGADMGGSGDGLILDHQSGKAPSPVPLNPTPQPPPGLGAISGQPFPGGSGGGLAGGPGSAPEPAWLDLQNPAPAPTQVSRVLGIGKLFDEIPDETERAKREAEIADRLSVVAEEQHLPCKVRLYHELHVIVVKGTPEAVALVEQTVMAMKENAGMKKPAAESATRR